MTTAELREKLTARQAEIESLVEKAAAQLNQLQGALFVLKETIASLDADTDTATNTPKHSFTDASPHAALTMLDS